MDWAGFDLDSRKTCNTLNLVWSKSTRRNLSAHWTLNECILTTNRGNEPYLRPDPPVVKPDFVTARPALALVLQVSYLHISSRAFSNFRGGRETNV